MYSQKQNAARSWLAKRRGKALSKEAKKYRTAALYSGRNFAVKGPRIGAPLATVLKANFRACKTFQLNGGAAGAIAVGTLFVNSLFDPFQTLGAEQPRGFDQLCGTLYQRYRVKKCKINVQFVASGALAAGNGQVQGFQITDTQSASTSFRDAIEQGYCSWAVSSGDPAIVNVLTQVVDVSKFSGRSYKDDENSADSSNNPGNPIVCHIFVQALDATIDLAVMNVLVTLDFETELFDPINVAAS